MDEPTEPHNTRTESKGPPQGDRKAVERPGMRKLLDYASAGDTVVVWRVDRLGRSLIDVLSTVNVLQGMNMDIRSV